MKRISSSSLQFIISYVSNCAKAAKTSKWENICVRFVCHCQPLLSVIPSMKSHNFDIQRQSRKCLSAVIVCFRNKTLTSSSLSCVGLFAEKFWYKLSRFFWEGAKQDSLVWVCTTFSSPSQGQKSCNQRLVFWIVATLLHSEDDWYSRKIDVVPSKNPKLPVMLV